jgi:hypothetical protein
MRKTIYITSVILLILVISNPSPNSFKEFSGKLSITPIERKSNYFICSVYQITNIFSRHPGQYFENKKEYFAILGHFFKIGEITTIIKPDSAKGSSR